MATQASTHFGSSIPGDPRIGWVDTAKGLCIVLVVMMHATLGVGEVMGQEGFMHAVVAFAKPFRMPDFFLISGLFLARVIDRDWRTYGDRRVVHFLYFYLLWLLIQSALKFDAVSGGTLAGFGAHLAYSLIEPFGTLWFVYLLAVFSVVTKLLRGLPPLVLLALAAVLEIMPIHTGSAIVNEACDRYVFFVAGYALAPQIFRLAEAAVADRRRAVLFLLAWAAGNGFFAFTPTGVAGFPTLASLPFVSLALGAAGACAIVILSAFLAGTLAGRPFAYAGERSIAVYLAFFLPMAVTRAVLIKTGIVTDVGTISLIVSAAAVIAPLILERLVRGTPARFLFERPAAFHITARKRSPRLQPAE